jgi:hypothetical protein
VESKLKVEVVRVRSDRRDPLHRGARDGDGLRRIDPAQRDAICPEHAKLGGECGQVTLERVEARVPAGGHEPSLVEPASNDRGIVAVQLVELDAVVTDLGDRPQDTLEIARAFVANRVEHQADVGLTVHACLSIKLGALTIDRSRRTLP